MQRVFLLYICFDLQPGKWRRISEEKWKEVSCLLTCPVHGHRHGSSHLVLLCAEIFLNDVVISNSLLSASDSDVKFQPQIDFKRLTNMHWKNRAVRG